MLDDDLSPCPTTTFLVQSFGFISRASPIPGLRLARSLLQVPEVGTAVRSLSASADGSLVVAANNNGTCYVWRLQRGAQLTTHFEPFHKLCAHDSTVLKCLISPDGRSAYLQLNFGKASGASGLLVRWYCRRKAEIRKICWVISATDSVVLRGCAVKSTSLARLAGRRTRQARRARWLCMNIRKRVRTVSGQTDLRH